MVDVPAVNVPPLEKTVPVPERVMVLEPGASVPLVMVKTLLTVVASCSVYVPPLPFWVRL